MDVTGRKRVEEAVRTVKARFEGILKIAQDAIISVDSNQRIMLFNQGAEKVFGYTQAEVVGGPLDLLLPQRLEDAHRKHIEGFGRSPDVAAVERTGVSFLPRLPFPSLTLAASSCSQSSCATSPIASGPSRG